MAWVPGGEFLMGSDRFYPEEGPARPVRVDGLWVDETPVTVADFARFVEATGHVTEAEIAPDPADYPGADPALLVPGSLVFRPSEGPVDLLHRVVEKPAAGGQRGVGDQDVDRTGLGGQPLDLLRVGEVGRDRPRAQFGGEGVERVRAATGEHQLGTLRGQRAGERLADSAVGSGDQHGRSSDVHPVLFSITVRSNEQESHERHLDP